MLPNQIEPYVGLGEDIEHIESSSRLYLKNDHAIFGGRAVT